MEHPRNNDYQPPPKKKKLLGHNLFKSLETGTLVDVAFLVGPGPQKLRIPAHKNVLSSMSDVFAAKLCNPNWNDGDTIELPEEIEEASVRRFLKYIYTEELDFEEMELSILLDVTSLGDMFLLKGLLASCEMALKERVSTTTCVQIYQETKAYEDSISVSKYAFEFITGNIHKVLEDMDPKDWSYEGLLNLLQTNYLMVEEIQLFRCLLSWRALCNPDEAKFQTLIDHIRFPVIDADLFADEVVPTGVLSKDDMLALFVYFNGTEKTTTRFNNLSRKSRIAVNAFALQELINSSSHGHIIQLEEKIYKGKFIIPVGKTKLTIQGCGEKTVLSGDANKILTVHANNFSFSNCTVLFKQEGIVTKGSNGTYFNLKLRRQRNHSEVASCSSFEEDSDGSSSSDDEDDTDKVNGIRIKGKNNLLRNIRVQGDNTGIGVNIGKSGDETVCKSCEFKSLEIGIAADSSFCTFKSATVLDTIRGIKVSGSLHVIDGVNYRHPLFPSTQGTTAFHVYGSKIRMRNVICHGRSRDTDYGIAFHRKSRDCEVQDCITCPILLSGANHKLTNVDGGDLIRINGKGHQLVNCRALGTRIKSSEGVVTEGCSFKV